MSGAASEIFFSLAAMSLTALFIDLAVRLQSPEFVQSAKHPAHPTGFTRRGKLPLPSLVGLMLTGMRMSIQAELDTFFGRLAAAVRSPVQREWGGSASKVVQSGSENDSSWWS